MPELFNNGSLRGGCAKSTLLNGFFTGSPKMISCRNCRVLTKSAPRHSVCSVLSRDTGFSLTRITGMVRHIMKDDKIIDFIQHYFESLFPKICPNCGRNYLTLHDFIINTQLLGLPWSYDIEIGNWEPKNPIGAMTLANCACGTTLGLSTSDMTLQELHSVLKWLRTKSARQGITPQELLSHIRDEITRRILAENQQDPV